jgi:hypothetical protein
MNNPDIAAEHHSNLVICPVGDASYHHAWLRGANRNFDLFLIYYGAKPGCFRQDAEYYLESGGVRSKLERIAEGYEAISSRLSRYSAICIPDNDILTTAKGFNRLFEEFRRYDLDWGHPSIAWPCMNGIPLQWHNPFTRVRYVNGTEMLCPVFKRDLFLRLLPTFGYNRSAWGIDLLWARMLENSGAKIALLDAVSFYHLHPRLRWGAKPNRQTAVRDYYQELSSSGVDSYKEFCELTERIKFTVKDIRETGRVRHTQRETIWAVIRAMARCFRVLLTVNKIQYARENRRLYLNLLRDPTAP